MGPNVFLVVPFLFYAHSETHIHTLTICKYAVAISQNLSQLCATPTFGEVLDAVDCVSRTS